MVYHTEAFINVTDRYLHLFLFLCQFFVMGKKKYTKTYCYICVIIECSYCWLHNFCTFLLKWFRKHRLVVSKVFCLVGFVIVLIITTQH